MTRTHRTTLFCLLVATVAGCGAIDEPPVGERSRSIASPFQPVAGTYNAVRATAHTAKPDAPCWAMFLPTEVANVTPEGYDEILPPDDLGNAGGPCTLTGREAYCSPRRTVTMDLTPFGFNAVLTFKELTAGRRQWVSPTSFVIAGQAVIGCSGDPLVCDGFSRCLVGSTATYALDTP